MKLKDRRPRMRTKKQIFKSLSCCIHCLKRTMQDASGHKFTLYSRGWFLRFNTFCADRCLTGGSPKSICYYDLFNHYSISIAPLAPSLGTAIEKERSKPRQAKSTQMQYQRKRTIGNIWQQSWEHAGIVKGRSVDVVGHECLVTEGLSIHVSVV